MSLVKQLGFCQASYVFLQLCLHDNERYTALNESKQSFYSTKNPLNLKDKLQKPSDFFLRCQTDNRSQDVEAIMEVLILSVPRFPPEKHLTVNGVTAGKLWSS